MMVYAPEVLEDTEYVDAPSEPPKAVIADAIRAATDPSVAKRVIDAKIVQVATQNRARAERTLRALEVPVAPRSSTMNGLFTWLLGTGKLSDLSKYTPAQREKLMAFLKAESLDVIEKTFTQDELDSVLVRIAAGVGQPAVAAQIADPYAAASKAYQAEVTSTLAPLGVVATKTGNSAAKIVSTGIVGMYQKGNDAPGRSFDWPRKAKLAIGLAIAGAGGYAFWPKIKPFLGV
jgi:hypothetical protein